MIKPVRHLLGVFFLFIGLLLAKAVWAWTAADTYVENTQFIGTGSYPQGIVVDDSGYVYVSDTKVDKYAADGTFIMSFGPSGPTDIAFDLDGNLLVVDYNNDRVQKWDTDGNYIATYFSAGTGDNNLSFPWQIAVDSQGYVYIAEYDNNRVHKFNSSMAHVGYIYGNGGAFDSPEGVAVDGDDNVIVMDSGNDRMQKFDSAGNFLWSITGANGGFNYSEAIRADSDGNIYVADSGNNRVQIYDADGNFVQQFGSLGAGLGQFNYPMGLGITSDGTLYVGDANDVQKFRFDRIAPSVSITALTGNTTTDTTPNITGTVTDALTVLTTIEYSIDSGSYTACTASDGAIDELSEEFTCTVSTTLSTGSHNIKVRGMDSKTNTNSGGTLGSYTFTVSSESSGSTSSTNSESGSNNNQGYQQIPASENGNLGSVLTPSGNSNSGGQDIVVIIEPGTFNFGGYLSVVQQPTDNFTDNLNEHPESNIVQTGGSSVGIITDTGEVAWQIGGIQEIYYKAYPPENSNSTPAIIVPEVQNKPSILSLGYTPDDLLNPGGINNNFSQNSLLIAFSVDGYHWKILENSVHDIRNKTLSIIQKIGGYYMIVSLNRNAFALERDTTPDSVIQDTVSEFITEEAEVTPIVTIKPSPTAEQPIETLTFTLPQMSPTLLIVALLGLAGVALVVIGLGYMRKP